MNVDDILERVKSLVASFEEQRKALVEELKPHFHGLFLPYLERHSGVENLYFTAYTPYFSDGDECTFSVNDLYGTVGDTEEWGCGYGPSHADFAYFIRTGQVTPHLMGYLDWYLAETKSWNGKISPPKYPSPEAAVRGVYTEELERTAEEHDALGAALDDFKTVRNVFDSIPDDIIRDLFGDHIKVTITREGVEVDEYSHD